MITEFPLLVFTVLTGIAAGAYVGAALFPKKGEDARPWLFPLIALVLVAAGGLAAMGHLGRPGLMMNVLNNPTSSLTMEGLSAGALAAVALVDAILGFVKKQSNRVVRVVGAVVGIVCMCIVTMAYTTSYGNPAWTAAPTLPLFFLGDLAAGLGLWLMLLGEERAPLANAIVAVCIALAVVLGWQTGVFAGFGHETMALWAGAVVAVVAAIAAVFVGTGRLNSKSGAIIVFVLVFVAVFVSRYGFYMASVI